MPLSLSPTSESSVSSPFLPYPDGSDPTQDLEPAVASLSAALDIPRLEAWLLVGEMALAAGKSELGKQAVGFAHELAPTDTRVGRLALRVGDHDDGAPDAAPLDAAVEASFQQALRRYHEFLKPQVRESQNRWIRQSAQIPGWLFPGEPELLWRLAFEGPPGQVLEIGTWMGKSACILAGSCLDRRDGSKVYCVDPFDLRGTDWQREFHRRSAGSLTSTFDSFIAQARRLGFYGGIVPIAKASEDLHGLIRAPLRVAFIDGWHDYDHVKADYDLAAPMIVPGGFLALHDATGFFPGVDEFADEVARSGEWEALDRAGSIAAFRRR